MYILLKYVAILTGFSAVEFNVQMTRNRRNNVNATPIFRPTEQDAETESITSALKKLLRL